ncbi:unnamed protein product [Meganyctiphanes norvegica]|uniref:Chitinase n=1 Tax=Meganyctiphanes norvegica TaxID=48144 RepID=A0AAV2RA08_MEGNR
MKLASVLMVFLAGLSLSEGIMMCYFGSWAVWRPGNGRFDVDDIDPHLCSHLVFGFAGIDPTTSQIKVLDEYNELCENWGRCAYNRFTGLKEHNPSLKTLLAVGGWTEGSENYSIMSADPARRKAFIDSSIAMILSHDFDGFDMDWEYPANRGGAPQDKENFITLMQEMKVALDAHGLILTCAVSMGKGTIDTAYDIPAMNQVFDYINLMAYDFHGAWETFTHHNAPLYAHPSDEGDAVPFNVDYGVNYWIENGASPEKLTLGIGTYGRCYTLDNVSLKGWYAPAGNPGHQGPFTRTPGVLGYNEICSFQLEGGWVIVDDPIMNEPYTYMLGNKIWCGYDHAGSVATKAAYAKNKGLAGTMVWSLETDDFKGLCGRPFDLVKTMVENFEDGAVFTTPGAVTGGATEATTTPAVNCAGGNKYSAHEYCESYWICNNGELILSHCPNGLLWNTDVNACDWPTNTDTSNCLMDGETAGPVETTQPPTQPPTTTPTTTTTTAPTTTTTTPTTTTATPTTTTTKTPIGPPTCDPDVASYYVPHSDCDKYWRCVSGNAILGFCQGGLLWNQSAGVCDWPANCDTSNCNMQAL